jgi:hypothetical protein
MMTRKDFQLIANAFRSAYDGSDPAYITQWCQDLAHVARALQTTNPRFDASRFLSAAQPKVPTDVC